MDELLDLTRRLDADLPIYTQGEYSDPPLVVEPWCGLADQGYAVARLTLGTQTGTHIDAPAHFIPGGAALEALPVSALIGQYCWINLDHPPDNLPAQYAGQQLLFLAAFGPGTKEISEDLLHALLQWPCRVWVIARDIVITGRAPLYFYQALFAAGRYLVENLDEAAAARVRPGGELIALPLRLAGVSGSPCRVIVRQPTPGAALAQAAAALDTALAWAAEMQLGAEGYDNTTAARAYAEAGEHLAQAAEHVRQAAGLVQRV